MIGDGVSLDQVGLIPGQAESGQFSMEVNDVGQACPALRHNGAANILFVDGHAANVFIKKTIMRPLVLLPVTTSAKVKSWESEYVNASGQPADLPAKGQFQTPESLGFSRNPNMPLIWSAPQKLLRYSCARSVTPWCSAIRNATRRPGRRRLTRPAVFSTRRG